MMFSNIFSSEVELKNFGVLAFASECGLKNKNKSNSYYIAVTISYLHKRIYIEWRFGGIWVRKWQGRGGEERLWSKYARLN